VDTIFTEADILWLRAETERPRAHPFAISNARNKFQSRILARIAVSRSSLNFAFAANWRIYSVGTSIQFTDSTKLRAQFWRLTRKGAPR
jgi:hypothetical protein